MTLLVNFDFFFNNFCDDFQSLIEGKYNLIAFKYHGHLFPGTFSIFLSSKTFNCEEFSESTNIFAFVAIQSSNSFLKIPQNFPNTSNEFKQFHDCIPMPKFKAPLINTQPTHPKPEAKFQTATTRLFTNQKTKKKTHQFQLLSNDVYLNSHSVDGNR